MKKEILTSLFRSLLGALAIVALYFVFNSDHSFVWNTLVSLGILLVAGIYIIEFIMLVIAGPIFYFTKHK